MCSARLGITVVKMQSALIADRIQFAFTIMFHYLFPIATMGLAPFVAYFTVKGIRNNDQTALRTAQFFGKIFALNFAAGVVTGIPMEFQFGTNWAGFSARAGSVVGQTLSMESVFAFFLESVFLGVFLYGRNRVTPGFYAACAVLIWIGSWLSGFFIVATNAWMQHPVGYVVTKSGTIELRNIGAVLLSSFAWWQYVHVLDGALLTGAFILAGIGAYYLLDRRHVDFAQGIVRAGVTVGIIASVIAIFPTGDRDSSDVTHFQPAKLAAMEGEFRSERGAPLAILGMPDTQHGVLIDPLYVPDLLSFLAYGNFRANVNGLSSYPSADRPPVDLTYYAYHIMVGLGSLFLAAMLAATVLLRRGRLFESRWMLWILMLAMPFPYIANEAGWTVAEVGRQPWIVYGLMRTSQGTSPTVVAGETIFTAIGFAGMYFLLGVVFLFLTLREIGHGPEQ
ncbi:MAG TPA: cytochrome ubiquinol oxidase subunit I [Candidatus Baltobacteraceae bacterium]|nr:cytochrome ubiquinol oxidase subunit I [Candidatus Baltobacteraceae bacterium]